MFSEKEVLIKIIFIFVKSIIILSLYLHFDKRNNIKRKTIEYLAIFIFCDLYDKQIFILICRVSLGELDNIQVRFASMSGIKSSKHSGKRMNVDETGVNSPSMAQSHLFRASVHGNFW